MEGSPALFRRVDSLQLHVPDIESALTFYRDHLGHALVWRAENAAGLAMADGGAELVIQAERETEIDLLVDSAGGAAERFVAAGGRLIAGPFDIQIGRAAVVEDPWGNRLVLLDMSKGRLVTDAEGNIIGNEPSG